MSYRKLAALEDAHKLQQLTALEDLKLKSFTDLTAEIPATLPEKMVYNYLVRLAVRFQFQYHMEDIEDTAYPEDLYIPDFNLPDYNTKIQIFGQYWHMMEKKRVSDLKQIAKNLYAGRAVIEHGIPLYPESGGFSGKYIIWWENEIYTDLPFLFVRDLPELFSKERIKGQPEEFILDREEQERRRRGQRAAMAVARMRPRVTPFERQLKKLRTRTMDLTKTFPFLKTLK